MNTFKKKMKEENTKIAVMDAILVNDATKYEGRIRNVLDRREDQLTWLR